VSENNSESSDLVIADLTRPDHHVANHSRLAELVAALTERVEHLEGHVCGSACRVTLAGKGESAEGAG
jgi:hypothetical protein